MCNPAVQIPSVNRSDLPLPVSSSLSVGTVSHDTVRPFKICSRVFSPVASHASFSVVTIQFSLFAYSGNLLDLGKIWEVMLLPAQGRLFSSFLFALFIRQPAMTCRIVTRNSLYQKRWKAHIHGCVARICLYLCTRALFRLVFIYVTYKHGSACT